MEYAYATVAEKRLRLNMDSKRTQSEKSLSAQMDMNVLQSAV